MKTRFKVYLREYFWNSIKNITNTFSDFTASRYGNGYIKCIWKISPIDNFRIELSKSCFYAIRLFDISNNRNINNSTCIMKEIQVSKFQSSISFPIPINKGVYYFEFGYRKRNGEWRKIAYQVLNLGYRVKKVIPSLDKDNWFNSNNRKSNLDVGLHEKAYQLSLNTPISGSERLSLYSKDS